MSRSVLAALAVMATVALVPAGAQAASVAIVGPSVTVRPTQTSWTGSTSGAMLSVAKNEFESFQVVVRSDGAAVTNVNLAMLAPLTGPGGATIPNSSVTIYREWYYDTTSANAYVSDNDSPGPGEYPDALIPKVDPWFGQARTSSFPVNIAAGRNAVGWVDVFVPAAQAAGDYTGSLRVTTSNGTLADVPITVTVANWTLPSTTTLAGGMDLNVNKLCTSSGKGVHDCANITGGQRGAQALYARVALDNRISIVRPGGAAPTGDAPFDTYTAPLLTGGTSPGIRSRLAGAQVRHVFVIGADAPDAAVWKQQGNAHGFLKRITFYCDEPGHDWNLCQQFYDSANAQWTATAPAYGNMPLAVTASIQDYNWAMANGFAAIASRVTTLIPHLGNLGMHDSWPPPAMAFPGHRNINTAGADNDYPDWVGAGKNLWWYHSCLTMGCSGVGNDAIDAEFDGFPSAGIDQPPMMARAASWNSFTYDIAGEYYYDVVKMLPSAWTSQWDGDGGNHGDGTLFYPGCVAGCGGGPAIGGTKDIPIESIRMKRIRDSHEDYEYLRKAEGLGFGPQARTIARNLFDNVIAADKTQAQLDAARAGLIALLPGSGTECNGVVPTIVGTAGADTLIGTAGADVISGLAGNDVITGLGGGDRICGGDGNDTIDGGAGDDRLDGGAGSDAVTFGTAAAGVTASLADGHASGDGADTLAAFENVTGTAGRDILTGNAGANALVGGAGDDDLIGGGEADSLEGGDGTDTLIGQAGNDTLAGGNGTDLADYSGATAAINGNVTGKMTGTATGTDALSGTEDIIATPYRDILIGDASDNYMAGGGGDDDLFGGNGADNIQGQAGNDTLEGQAGNDVLNGGAGTDYLQYTSAPAAVTASLATGTASGGAGADAIAEIEDLGGSAFDDTLTGNTQNNYVYGDAGADTIDGGTGADYYAGGDGDDHVSSRDTNAETVNCGAGADVVDADFLDVANANCETVWRA